MTDSISRRHSEMPLDGTTTVLIGEYRLPPVYLVLSQPLLREEGENEIGDAGKDQSREDEYG